MNRFIFLAVLFLYNGLFAQQSNYFFRPEILVGKSIPSYELWTGKNPQIVLGASYAHQNYKPKGEWQTLLNYPTTGLSLYVSHYGEKTKGNSVSLIPFIEFYYGKKQKWSTKFGMGISYFDTKYNAITNPNNEAISSDFTWAIQGFVYYDFMLKNNFDFRLGLGVFHHSNGHTKLPNQGINSGLLSVSTRLSKTPKNQTIEEEIFDTKTVKKISGLYYGIRYGNGIQTFVFEDSPLKTVHNISLTGGVFYKNIVRLSLGLNARHYLHYYDYIIENETVPFIDKPFINASNIYVSLGAEILLDHFGIDWEGGLNLHKPFYKKHYALEGLRTGGELKYKLKNLFLGRLGIKYYLKNNTLKPKNNFYFGAHINSNLSQADFSELSFGFVHRLR
ncbi:MAG: acyloxyacyl hydrolase [Flavobacteriaceae bacterium]